MQEKSLEERKELLEIVDLVPDNKIDDLKLIISGYMLYHENLQHSQESA